MTASVAASKKRSFSSPFSCFCLCLPLGSSQHDSRLQGSNVIAGGLSLGTHLGVQGCHFLFLRMHQCVFVRTFLGVVKSEVIKTEVDVAQRSGAPWYLLRHLFLPVCVCLTGMLWDYLIWMCFASLNRILTAIFWMRDNVLVHRYATHLQYLIISQLYELEDLIWLPL